MGSDNGQRCPDCKGIGVVIKKRGGFSFMNRNKVFTDEKPEICQTCYGTGWLQGRSQ